ncbi:MAG: hypothetical protein ACR2G4_05195 [Pyrinomonadaceae bacterium]
MHDCRLTQEHLLDLIFDELDAPARVRLLAEVDDCADCRVQYRAAAAALRNCDEVAAVSLPSESYWPAYHDALSRRLRAAERDEQTNNAPFWKRLFIASIRVPAPLAATVVLLLLASSVLTLFLLVARPAPAPVVISAPNASPQVAPQIKEVEVPVLREKTIIRTVYVPRRGGGGDGGARRRMSRENLARSMRPNATQLNAGVAPRANLSGFKPADEVKLRIIRKGDPNELSNEP